MSESFITTKNLNMFYHGIHALKDINVCLPEKKVIAVIGSSGCGKTTFLKCLNRMVELVPGAKVMGQVYVNNENIYADEVDVTSVRKRIGLIAQRPTPLPMSVFENVAYGPRLFGAGSAKELRERVQRCLETVGLWDEVRERLKDPANRLSIGQQQRLCLARGLAVEPEILLFDEPTSSLDPASSMRIERAIIDLKTDYTCIVVTHNLSQAKRIADYVLFMCGGELVEQGEAQSVFESPQEKLTCEYLREDCQIQ